jgi:hypothetical protein
VLVQILREIYTNLKRMTIHLPLLLSSKGKLGPRNILLIHRHLLKESRRQQRLMARA